MAFDKTGTLTVGKPRVTAIHPATGISESELLTLAAAVEQGATHPLAQAIVREAQVAALAIPAAESQRALVGSGIEAQVNGERVLICAAGKHPADAFAGLINELESAGQTVVLVVRNDDVLGVIALQDTLRADAATAISELNALGVKGVILTGDNPRAAAAIAGELGLEFKAGLLPEDKVKAVTELNQHAPLAMVGDGINDAPAMKAAAIGIAMGSGTDVALETADAALTHNHLRGLVQMIELAPRHSRQYPPEHHYCAGAERDLPRHHAVRNDRTMAGGAGRYGCDGAGDSECVKIVAQEIRQTDRNIERDRSPRPSGERVRVRGKGGIEANQPPSTAFTNQITIRQSIRLFRNQFVFHKGTKPGNIAGSGRIVGDNQQRFAGLHIAHSFAHHHYGFRAAQAKCVECVVRAGKEIGHFLLIT